jgi:hypothetical protein
VDFSNAGRAVRDLKERQAAWLHVREALTATSSPEDVESACRARDELTQAWSAYHRCVTAPSEVARLSADARERGELDKDALRALLALA